MRLFGKISLRLAAFLFGLGVALPAFAQVSNPVLILTAQAAGTVNSGAQTSLSGSGKSVTCVFNQTSHTGTPSSTVAIQARDPSGSGLYYTLITSTAITADATPTAVAAGKGLSTTANVSTSLPIGTAWRVSITVAGTTPVVTGAVGCFLS